MARRARLLRLMVGIPTVTRPETVMMSYGETFRAALSFHHPIGDARRESERTAGLPHLTENS